MSGCPDPPHDHAQGVTPGASVRNDSRLRGASRRAGERRDHASDPTSRLHVLRWPGRWRGAGHAHPRPDSSCHCQWTAAHGLHEDCTHGHCPSGCRGYRWCGPRRGAGTDDPHHCCCGCRGHRPNGYRGHRWCGPRHGNGRDDPHPGCRGYRWCGPRRGAGTDDPHHCCCGCRGHRPNGYRGHRWCGPRRGAGRDDPHPGCRERRGHRRRSGRPDSGLLTALHGHRHRGGYPHLPAVGRSPYGARDHRPCHAQDGCLRLDPHVPDDRDGRNHLMDYFPGRRGCHDHQNLADRRALQDVPVPRGADRPDVLCCRRPWRVLSICKIPVNAAEAGTLRYRPQAVPPRRWWCVCPATS